MNSNSEICQSISFGANEKFAPNFGENYATLYLMINSKDLFECCRRMGLTRETKVVLANFSEKSQVSNLDPNLPSFIYFNNLFEKLSSIISSKRKTKSNNHFSQAPCRKMGNLDESVSNLCNVISRDSLCQYLRNVKYHNGAQ